MTEKRYQDMNQIKVTKIHTTEATKHCGLFPRDAPHAAHAVQSAGYVTAAKERDARVSKSEKL